MVLFKPEMNLFKPGMGLIGPDKGPLRLTNVLFYFIILLFLITLTLLKNRGSNPPSFRCWRGATLELAPPPLRQNENPATASDRVCGAGVAMAYAQGLRHVFGIGGDGDCRGTARDKPPKPTYPENFVSPRISFTLFWDS